MSPAKIKAALILKGISQTEIAEALGEDRASVSGVINGTRKTRSIREAVVKALGKNPKAPEDMEEVFPDEKFRRPSGRIVKRVGFAA